MGVRVASRSEAELERPERFDEASPSDWAAVGLAIRERRLAANLTLVELAARVGLSQPFLSQIENGRARLSMKSLYRIAREFDTTPQALFGEPALDDAEPTLVAAGDARGVEFAEEGPEALCRVLLPGGAPFHVLEFIGLPGEFPNYWEHDGFEAVYVVAGDLELDIDGTVHPLSAGDFMSYPSRLPHRLRSSSTEVRVLMIESPVGGTRDRHHGTASTDDAGTDR
jgi:transcriptional regulator with XRE-family HTH domain